MSDLHWLVQELAGELAGNAAWTAVGVGAAYAWKYRSYLADKLKSKPQDIIVHAQPLTLRAEARPALITVGSERTASWDELASVGSERTILWNVEAPTPSLARRLEELAAWYLHVS